VFCHNKTLNILEVGNIGGALLEIGLKFFFFFRQACHFGMLSPVVITGVVYI
jgi:hypothetical protein